MVITRKIIPFLLTIVFLNPVFSQQVSQENKDLTKLYLEIADEILVVTKALDQAREQYIKAADIDPTNVDANYKAGDAIIKTIGKERAAKYFEQVYAIDPDYRFDLLYKIGRSYQYNMNFDKALDYYNRYKEKLIAEDEYLGKDKVKTFTVDRNIYECNNGKKLMSAPARYSIINVGSAINTKEREYAPVLNKDETEMVFTSRRREENLNQNVADDNVPYEDIFISKKVDGIWQPAQNMGEIINTRYHDSNLAMSADGKQLFLYSDNNNGDIYISRKLRRGGWVSPVPLGENINSPYKESSVNISPDGNLLFFASDRPSDIGSDENLNIYYCTKNKKDVWGEPKMLGKEINSEFNEDAPFLDYDGKTLYFSSDGRGGMGGYDIFSSVYDSTKEEWGEPKNIGFPVNTPDDDVFFVSTKDGKRGYYASVREYGMGYTDIYMVTVIDDHDVQNQKTTSKKKINKDSKPLILTVSVEDIEKRLPIDANIELKNIEDNVIVSSKRENIGTYTFDVKNAKDKKYMLSVEKKGYVFKNMKIDIEASTELTSKSIRRNISLQKIQKGVSRILKNIYFDFDKATFTTDSYGDLSKLEKMLTQNINTQVEIAGHTDAIGNNEYNKKLSQSRANAVMTYLTDKGIEQRRITAVGYGEEKPLATNDDDDEGRELNRRVEFKIIK